MSANPLTTLTSPTRGLRGGPPPRLPTEAFGQRYRPLEVLGTGGFGVIWRVFDESLKLPAVVKIVRLRSDRERAFVTALLSKPPIEMTLRHPHIAPIRARGRSSDGEALWMAMDLIEGGTFADLVAALHPQAGFTVHATVASSADGADPPAGDTQTKRPLTVPVDPRGRPVVEAQLEAAQEVLRLLVQAAEGVGAAHDIGIVHRDLKPDNLMFDFGPDGERTALVIDWGLAHWNNPEAPPPHPVEADVLIGVPEYLAPERLADPTVATPASDVYALGAILYTILVGRPPPKGGLVGLTPPAGIATAVPEWFEICRVAMAETPGDRFRDGAAFAASLTVALAEVKLRNLEAKRSRARRHREHARLLRRRADDVLSPLDPWDDPKQRVPAWLLQDQAGEQELLAAQAVAQWLYEVEVMLRRTPDLPSAHLALAEHHCAALQRAEADGEALDARLHHDRLRLSCGDIREAETRCRSRGVRLLDQTAHRIEEGLARFDRILRGGARLTLLTAPAGCRCDYAPIVERERRWVPERWTPLGETPLRGVAIAHGRGLVRIHVPGCARPVIYPIAVARGQHWDGVPPGARRPHVIDLPDPSWDERDICIAAGWTRIGGDPRAADPLDGRRIWIDAFVMRANPVTFAEYGEYIQALVDADRIDEARQRLPAFRPDGGTGRPEASSAVGMALGERGEVVIDAALADLPVWYVDWESASAYAAWRADHTGEAWRLPSEWEYEKAARGVDGRRFPWGDHFEERWTRVINTAFEARPAPVDHDTLDESVYGVRWLVGNRLTWCLEAYRTDGPADGSRLEIEATGETGDALRVNRGGAFCIPRGIISTATRFADRPDKRTTAIGIRLVRSLAAHAPTGDAPRPATEEG